MIPPSPRGRAFGRGRGERGRACPRPARGGGHAGEVARGGDRGSLSAETVLLAPVFLLFLLFVVGAGRVVEAQGEVNGAARDAARAASVERTRSGAEAAASEAARAALANECAPGVSLEGTRWEAGGTVRAVVTCTLDLDFLGFGAAKEMRGDAVVPLERFRRVG
ncbi:hypothetical protein GCM10017673_40770 [Streptosporangium violaceochromogenes]|nr:hypothetical protein GCM10017673_40770 [Streptosporangium violaceochromogenes]